MGGMTVMIYFWDARDGADQQGWWFAPDVGDEQVWAYRPAVSFLPPVVGWRVPHDGPVDRKMKVKLMGETEKHTQAAPMATPLVEGAAEPYDEIVEVVEEDAKRSNMSWRIPRRK